MRGAVMLLHATCSLPRIVARALSMLLLGLLMLVAPALQASELVLQGWINGDDNHSYKTLAFDVPENTARLTIHFAYTGREQKTVIDLGLLDPDGLRGWSGGSKSMLTVAASDATPSYRPGSLQPGRWQLLLGIPNIRAGQTSQYTARIELTPDTQPDTVPEALKPMLDANAGWYRGDLHMHSAHSDASCDSQRGVRVPCPLFLTLEAASARGLDFVAITDHNTVSHLQPMRELQPYFDRLLLIPGMELTTFQGHANVLGLEQQMEFRLGSPLLPDWNTVLAQVQRRGLLLSINHPVRPNDERCMGCGWTPRDMVDMGRIRSVEVVNGGDADTPLSGIPFWHAQLDQGLHMTGVGGSDNHDARRTQPGSIGTSPVGMPATVVWATGLSQDAILEGIRAGRVFIDVEGSPDRVLDLELSCGGTSASMGAALAPAAGLPCTGAVVLQHVPEGRVELLLDGRDISASLDAPTIDGTSVRRLFQWPSDGQRHWLRANVRSAQGQLLLVGNPIYLQADPMH